MEICTIENCKEQRIAFSQACWRHTEKKDEYTQTLCGELEKGTKLTGLNFSKACLRNLNLSRSDFSGANLSRADLSGANIFDANFRGAELVGANLSGADLTGADLQQADMTRANLFGARLWHSNFKSSNLIEANLSSADFWNTELFDTRIWRTDFSDAISLGKKNFLHAKNKYLKVFRINEKGVYSAENAYRTLKRYFLTAGRYNDASWASFKEKTMEKLRLKKQRDPAYIPSLIMDLLCGYGEKTHRIIISSFTVILFYALSYLALNAVTLTSNASYKLTLTDNLYYSIITFTTLGYGDFIPKANPFFRIFAASEAFIGVFMIGLFIFTLARKYSAR